MIIHSMIYTKKGCKLTVNTPYFQINKRFMLTLRKFYPTISLIPKTSPNMVTRFPSFVAEGTLLVNKDYGHLRKLLYNHNKHLSNLDFGENIDSQMISFYDDVLFIAPKIVQHIMSVTYPRAAYSKSILSATYPNINIDSGKNPLFVTEDVITTTVVAGGVMKRQSIFQGGQLIVLACDEHNPLKTKKEVKNKVALAQTKQEHPDYYYAYKPSSTDKNSGIWQRYYDFKAGDFKIDTGHIVCFSNKEEYETRVGHHLYAQHNLYKTVNRDIDDQFTKIIGNPKLTWSDRNIKIQEFFRDNLHKYPNINPSFILYNPLLYEIENQRVPKNANNFVIESSLGSVENTQELMAKSIYSGGKTCYENYLKHPYKSPIIVGFIKDMIKNSSSSS